MWRLRALSAPLRRLRTLAPHAGNTPAAQQHQQQPAMTASQLAAAVAPPDVEQLPLNVRVGVPEMRRLLADYDCWVFDLDGEFHAAIHEAVRWTNSGGNLGGSAAAIDAVWGCVPACVTHQARSGVATSSSRGLWSRWSCCAAW